HEGDDGAGVRAARLAAGRQALAHLRADQRGDVLLLRAGAPAGARGAGATAGRAGEEGGDHPAHARDGVGRRRARRVDGVGRRGVGALTGQRTLRSRSTICVVADSVAAGMAWTGTPAETAMLAL